MTTATKVNIVKQKIDDKMADPHDFDYRMSVKVRNLIKKAIDYQPPSSSSSSEVQEKEVGEEKSNHRTIEIIQDSQQQLIDLLEFDRNNNELLSYEQMELIHKHLQRVLPSYPFEYFYQLNEQFRSFPKQQSKNLELAKRLKELKFQQSKSYYKEITGKILVDPNEFQISSVTDELKGANQSLIAILNGLLVIIGTFVFVYKAVEYSSPHPDIPLQVLAGFLVSLVVAIAELYWIFKII